MLLGILSVLIVLAVAYAYLREGIFTACMMFINVVLAGLVAMNFFEPLADLLDGQVADSFLHGYEDAICLVALFGATLGMLRTMTNAVARSEILFPQWVRRGGGALFGAATGYLVAGFLLCVLQTLPWHEEFMNFRPPDVREPRTGIGRIMPPDRVWLAMMHRAGAYAFANNEDDDPLDRDPEAGPASKYVTFDKYGTFEIRYARYRRYGDTREAKEYFGELDAELHKRGR